MEKKFRAVIPAGGKGARSGLNYPKSLHPVGGIPILIRVCKTVAAYDRKPVIVINPDFEEHFREVLKQYSQEAEIVHQPEPLGMGDAVLRTDDYIRPDEQVILVWSDIAMLTEKTVDALVKCHLVSDNTLSLATFLGDNCYTILQRNNGIVHALIETRAEGIPPAEKGERDIGVFVFRKNPVFDVLRNQPLYSEKTGRKELGFLYVIAKLTDHQLKCEGYPIAEYKETLSFNTADELKAIEEYLKKSS